MKDFKQAKILINRIEELEEALEKLNKSLKENKEPYFYISDRVSLFYADFYFNITKHTDNVLILKVVKEEIERQLTKCKKEFSNI